MVIEGTLLIFIRKHDHTHTHTHALIYLTISHDINMKQHYNNHFSLLGTFRYFL